MFIFSYSHNLLIASNSKVNDLSDNPQHRGNLVVEDVIYCERIHSSIESRKLTRYDF